MLITLCGLSSSTFSQTLPPYVPTDSLLGWWEFTGNANDESGNGNHGIVNGAVLTADRFSNPDNAFSFNGTTDYIEVADTPQLRLSNTDFTFSFWVKLDSFTIPATGLISKRTNGSLNGWILVANGTFSDRIELKTSQGSDPSIFSDSTLSIGAWHHVVVVYNQATTVDFYFDGILINSESSLGLYFNPNCSSVLRFGHDTNTPPGSYFLNGSLDDIGIWNRALTSQQISNLFLQTTTSVNDILKTELEIYPNPVNDILRIINNPNENEKTAKITDLSGRLQLTSRVDDSGSIDVSHLHNGVYVLILGDQNQAVRKFIKH
jgi:hypothetical protein